MDAALVRDKSGAFSGPEKMDSCPRTGICRDPDPALFVRTFHGHLVSGFNPTPLSFSGGIISCSEYFTDMVDIPRIIF